MPPLEADLTGAPGKAVRQYRSRYPDLGGMSDVFAGYPDFSRLDRNTPK
jgi:hypothetical protein